MCALFNGDVWKSYGKHYIMQQGGQIKPFTSSVKWAVRTEDEYCIHITWDESPISTASCIPYFYTDA